MSPQEEIKIDIGSDDDGPRDEETSKTNLDGNDAGNKEDVKDSSPEDIPEDIKKPQKKESDVKAELESAKKEAKENYERFLRMAAELENYKRLAAREKDDLRKYANEYILREILGVADALEKAVEMAQQDKDANKEIIKGLDITLKEFSKLFNRFNVKSLESVGKSFDPKFHEAMMQEPSSDYPDNTVLKELQKGYMLHDRLLRPAMVIVSKLQEPKAEA